MLRHAEKGFRFKTWYRLRGTDFDLRPGTDFVPNSWTFSSLAATLLYRAVARPGSALQAIFGTTSGVGDRVGSAGTTLGTRSTHCLRLKERCSLSWHLRCLLRCQPVVSNLPESIHSCFFQCSSALPSRLRSLCRRPYQWRRVCRPGRRCSEFLPGKEKWRLLLLTYELAWWFL